MEIKRRETGTEANLPVCFPPWYLTYGYKEELPATKWSSLGARGFYPPLLPQPLSFPLSLYGRFQWFPRKGCCGLPLYPGSGWVKVMLQEPVKGKVLPSAGSILSTSYTPWYSTICTYSECPGQEGAHSAQRRVLSSCAYVFRL